MNLKTYQYGYWKACFIGIMLIGPLSYANQSSEGALETKPQIQQEDPSNAGAEEASLHKKSPRGSISLDVGRFIIAYGTVGVRYEGAVLPWLDITIPISVTTKSLSIWSLTDANVASIFPFFALSGGVGAKFHGDRWFVELFSRAGYAWLFSSSFDPFHLICKN